MPVPLASSSLGVIQRTACLDRISAFAYSRNSPLLPMQRILSSYLFLNRKFTPELLGAIARSGVNALELFCSTYHFDYRSSAAAGHLASMLRDNNMTLHALHAPTERDSGPTRYSGVPLS